MTTAIINQMLNAIQFGNTLVMNNLKQNFPEQVGHIDYYIGLLERRANLQAPNRKKMGKAVNGLYFLSALCIVGGIILALMSFSQAQSHSYSYLQSSTPSLLPIMIGGSIGGAISFAIVADLVSQHYDNQYIQASFLHKLLLFSEEVSTQDMQALEQNIMQCKAALTEEIKQFLTQT